jgi:hypothetical protein
VARRGRNRVDRALSGAERRVRRGASWRRQPCPRCTRSGPGRFSFACSMVRATGIPALTPVESSGARRRQLSSLSEVARARWTGSTDIFRPSKDVYRRGRLTESDEL